MLTPALGVTIILLAPGSPLPPPLFLEFSDLIDFLLRPSPFVLDLICNQSSESVIRPDVPTEKKNRHFIRLEAGNQMFDNYRPREIKIPNRMFAYITARLDYIVCCH